MPGFFTNLAIYLVVYCAVFYQFMLSPLLWTTLGVGRKVQNLEEFDATCEKIEGLGLEACEDMWFHDKSGLLYMSCGSTLARTQWLPSVDAFNISGRQASDRIAILDTRGQGPIADRLKWASTIGYVGADGGKSLDLHGFDVHVGPGDEPMLKLLLINHRPPVDPVTRQFLDAEVVGANSTIEVFNAKLGDPVLRHVKTYHDEAIQTPNRVAWVGSGAFVFTNDKSGKVGWRRHLDVFIGGGSVGYCNKTDCSIAASSGFNYPNGLTLGADGNIYVPSAITGKIFVMKLQPDNTLKKISTIRLPMPIDNLSVDSKGDIYAAGFPEAHLFAKHQQTPHEVRPWASIWKIRKTMDEPLLFDAIKVLEGSGDILPGATIAIHDPRTRRFFLGGAISDHITICEFND